MWKSPLWITSAGIDTPVFKPKLAISIAEADASYQHLSKYTLRDGIFCYGACMSTKKSRLLEQSERIHFESTKIALLRKRAETLARCHEAQSRTSRQLVFGLDAALELLCIEVLREVEEQLRSRRRAPFSSSVPTQCSVPNGWRDAAAEPTPAEDLIILADSRASRRRMWGLRCVQWSHPVETITSCGITCVAPLDTWLMFASYVGLTELVLLGDAMMRRDADMRWLSLDDFDRRMREFERDFEYKGLSAPRGLRNCRRALHLMREGTDSPPETQVRLLLESYGLPCPAVNMPVDVMDERGAKQRYYLDLAFPQWRVAVEYDGRHHAEAWENDQRRIKLLGDAQWSLINVTRNDLYEESRREGLVRSVTDRIARRGGKVTPLGTPMSLRQLTDRRRSRARLGDGEKQ